MIFKSELDWVGYQKKNLGAGEVSGTRGALPPKHPNLDTLVDLATKSA